MPRGAVQQLPAPEMRKPGLCSARAPISSVSIGSQTATEAESIAFPAPKPPNPRYHIKHCPQSQPEKRRSDLAARNPLSRRP